MCVIKNIHIIITYAEVNTRKGTCHSVKILHHHEIQI